MTHDSGVPMTAKASPTTHIVVGIDYSSLSEHALYAAFDVALARPMSELHVITVAEGIGPTRPEEATAEARKQFHDEAEATLQRYVEQRLAGLERTGAKLPHERINIAVDFGSPTERILALAEKVRADLIVIGTHGRKGLDLLAVGSVAEDVLRHAHCTVLVTKERHRHQRES